jgi:hypothetical protein
MKLYYILGPVSWFHRARGISVLSDLSKTALRPGSKCYDGVSRVDLFNYMAANHTLQMDSLPTLTQSLNTTVVELSFPPVPTSLPLISPASLTTRGHLSVDTTINITFGVFMALLALIGICQAAHLAALQTRRCKLSSRCPTFCSSSTLTTLCQSLVEIRAKRRTSR